MSDIDWSLGADQCVEGGDEHTAVLPKLNVEAFHAAITVHHEPIARALDRDVN